ncbi:hypothetical protein Pyrde_0716 [Pyrodictium delaneyi]|uniref:Uncharacterized protein n=1 Tax=Pyrodictium delaneyi TaxID=1273541 RepID=A0A0P0N242_9CREN|nr:hypothetical protein [Pyrodictium delaneyi]ALL00766.1 hypothetical protein Pyrde_0716 [Pyrodictium delaneyi]
MVRKISVSDQAYELLNRLREELGTATHSETILVLADRARLCSDIEPRLRKIELLLHRLLEEHTGRTAGEEEGPESPAGGAVKEGRKEEHAPRRTVTRPLDADRSAPEPLRRGREPRTQHIEQTSE